MMDETWQVISGVKEQPKNTRSLAFDRVSHDAVVILRIDIDRSFPRFLSAFCADRRHALDKGSWESQRSPLTEPGWSADSGDG